MSGAEIYSWRSMTFFFFTEGISETSKYFFCVVHYLSLCCAVLSPYPASSHPPRSALHVQVLQPCYQMQSSTLSLWKAKSAGATPHRALLFQPGKGRGKWEIGGKWAKHRMKWDLGSSWDRVMWSTACWDEILREAFGGEKEWQLCFWGEAWWTAQEKVPGQWGGHGFPGPCARKIPQNS